MKKLGFFTSAILLALFVLSPTVSNADSIAYIHNAGGSVDYLESYGHTVTYMNDPVDLTLDQLLGFDAVLVASNLPFEEPENIGNVLAYYADAGGGVVLSQFCFQELYALSGKVMTSGYSPFTADLSGPDFETSFGLGTLYEPGNPMLLGVNTANVKSSHQAIVGMDPGASLVADWPTGRHAIGYNCLPTSKVVGLNLFPSVYTTNVDTQHLIANAIEYSHVVVPVPGAVLLGMLGLSAAGLKLRKHV